MSNSLAAQIDTAHPTAALAALTANLRIDDLPPNAIELLSKCTLDWIGVTAGGAALAESSPVVTGSLEQHAGQGSRCRRWPLADISV